MKTLYSPEDGEGHGLSHLDARGTARMVDVGDKPITHRTATAEGRVTCSPELVARIREHGLEKGDLIGTARLAGVLGAKRVDELIPLCHTLPLDRVDVEITIGDAEIRLRATASTRARTGVEMEALTAVAVAALTVIDMGKAVDRTMTIQDLRVVEKTGGRSGDWVRESER
ncbi:MAG: cyclic pyranopterin monophosphate synthase MoaC [Gemmatimonadales bacterium]|nr:MAG: cyclic pyranopterin monophosphate synthase MoaC [Gemmatimonadales bacterium]